MSEAMLTGDQRAIRKFLGVVRPFEDDLKGGKLAAAQSFYERHRVSSGQGMLVRAAVGRRQALVKVVRNGGARNMKQLGTQIAYITREGALGVWDNPLGDHQGATMSGEELTAKLAAWEEEFKGNPKLGHTTHVVVSFPAGTDRAAAARAGLAFGERAFSSDLGGDCFDWVAVQHDDTAYPHMHFIVKNRGLYADRWFTIKRGSDHDVNALRELQVEVAAEFGIELTATRRLERGLTDAPVMTDEYRQAQKEGRAPEAEPRTPVERHMLKAIVSEHAETLEKLADAYAQVESGIAAVLRDSAALLRDGKELPVMDQTREPIRGEGMTAEDRAIVAEVEQGVSDQFDGPANEFSKFEALIVDRATNRDRAETASSALDLARDLNEGRLDPISERRADALLRDTMENYDKHFRGADLNDSQWEELQAVRGQYVDLSPEAENRAIVAEVEQGVSDQFDGPADEFSKFEALIVDRATNRDRAETASSALDLARDLNEGRLDPISERRADALLRDTMENYDKYFRGADLNDSQWEELQAVRGQYVDLSPEAEVEHDVLAEARADREEAVDPVRAERISQAIDADIARLKSIGYDRTAIESGSREIEDRAIEQVDRVDEIMRVVDHERTDKINPPFENADQGAAYRDKVETALVDDLRIEALREGNADALNNIIEDRTDRLYAAKAYLQSDERTANSDAVREVISEIAERERDAQPQKNIGTEDAISRVEQMKQTIADNIARGEAQLDTDTDPVVKTMREINIAGVKARAAQFFPEREDYQRHAAGEDGTYAQNAFRHHAVAEARPEARGDIEDGYGRAEGRVVAELEQSGVNAEAFMARYKANEPVPEALADKWRADDLRDIRSASPELAEDQAGDRLEKLHAFARDQFRDANREIGHMLAGRGIMVEPDRTEERLDAIERNQATRGREDDGRGR